VGTMADDFKERAATYLGLRKTTPGVPRSQLARTVRPGSDSSRGELGFALAVSLVFIVGFVAAVVTQGWLGRVLASGLLLFVYVPLFVRSVWYLRRMP